MVGSLDDYRIALDILGDDVDPDKISRMLGAEPTKSHRKGDAIRGADGTFRRRAISGRWSIERSSRDINEPDFGTSLRELLDLMTDNLDIWNRLSDQFDTGLCCGIFLTDSNSGFTISPELMSALSDRNLYLGLDLYGPELPQSKE